MELSLAAVSVTAISKTLQKIAEAEAVPLNPEQAKSIAATANGDLLNAIETLQLYSTGKVDLSLLKTKKGKKVQSSCYKLCFTVASLSWLLADNYIQVGIIRSGNSRRFLRLDHKIYNHHLK